MTDNLKSRDASASKKMVIIIMMVMLITIMIKIMNVEYIWPTSLMKCESFAVTYDFNQLIYAVCSPPRRFRPFPAWPRPIYFWPCPSLPRTALVIECCEKYKSFKLKIPQPDSERHHSPDFRTVFGIMIGPFSSCEIGKT